MAKNVKKSVITALRAWLCLLLSILLVLGLSYFKILPVIKRYAESVAETVMLNSANEAIVSVLQSDGITYDEIAKLSRAEDGSVQSLEIDVYKINNFKSRISNEISNIIANREEFKLKIPVGSFFDTPYTSGIGPKIPFNMQLTSTAFVDFTHEFKAAGINQTLHLIHIKIKIRGSFITAWYTGSVAAETTAIAAQTVIVGATPDAFTNVIEDINDNTAGLINDYGALAGE
ncbi:MAG: sporulation protein YunB [Clostridia bacterium]|nr:sporulation protein YunB [Clostridia bacterium]